MWLMVWKLWKSRRIRRQIDELEARVVDIRAAIFARARR